MLNLENLEQLVAFAELGTLSEVAKKFSISSPSLSRNMQRLEEDFGVTLFNRTVNKIQLNENGKKAVEMAKTILATTSNAIHEVQRFDQAQKTIYISACAPVPLWQTLNIISSKYSNKLISHKLTTIDEVLSDIKEGHIHFAILPYPLKDSSYQVSNICQTLDF